MAKYRVIEEKAGSAYRVERWCTESGCWRSVNDAGNLSYYSRYSNTENYYVRYASEENAVAHARHFAVEHAPYQWIKRFTGKGGTFWVRARDDNRALVVRDLRVLDFFQSLEGSNIEIVNDAGVNTKDWYDIPLTEALARAERLARGTTHRVIAVIESKDVITLTMPESK